MMPLVSSRSEFHNQTQYNDISSYDLFKLQKNKTDDWTILITYKTHKEINTWCFSCQYNKDNYAFS